MNALVLLTLLTADPACFVARDNQPGWKQVSMPPGVRYLAAPDGVEQFRTGDPVEVFDNHPGIQSASWHTPGRTQFELSPANGACEIVVTFRSALRGAKVDVSAWGASGNQALLREERVPGSTLKLSWADVGVRSVTITVHDHLREEPVIDGWTSRCVTQPSRLGISEAYSVGASLYYLQPAGGSVPLCNKAAIAMRVQGKNLPRGELPTAVHAKPD